VFFNAYQNLPNLPRHAPYFSYMELLENIQCRYTKMINDMKGKKYEDKLRCLRLWTLEERRNRQDLIEVFKMYTLLIGLPVKQMTRLST